jgi:hypothetical protein
MMPLMLVIISNGDLSAKGTPRLRSAYTGSPGTAGASAHIGTAERGLRKKALHMRQQLACLARRIEPAQAPPG